jgi:hypothetical protein
MDNTRPSEGWNWGSSPYEGAIFPCKRSARRPSCCMKITCTHEEYRRLLDMLCIADQVINSYIGEDRATVNPAPYEDLYRKALAAAKSHGCEHLVSFDFEQQCEYYRPEEDGESAVSRFMDDFKDRTFWDELIFRLAERDLEREERGRADVQALFKGPNGDELREALQKKKEEDYRTQFTDHGLDPVILLRQSQSYS